MIQLDTSFLIVAQRVGTPAATQLDAWTATGKELRLSAATWAEFRCGPVVDRDVDAALLVFGEPLTIGRREAELAARSFNHAGRRRGSMMDCLIAASCIARDHSLATLNEADFARFESVGLRLAR